MLNILPFSQNFISSIFLFGFITQIIIFITELFKKTIPKIMRTTILLFALSLVTLLATSCKTCNNDDPTARIINNGTGSADVQIKGADGDIVQISDLAKGDRKSTRLNSSHVRISYAVFCMKKKSVTL